MKIEIKIPNLTKKEDKFVLCQWNVSEGDIVEKGEVLCEAEINKTVTPIEAECKMQITKLLVEDGDEVSTEAVIAYAETL